MTLLEYALVVLVVLGGAAIGYALARGHQHDTTQQRGRFDDAIERSSDARVTRWRETDSAVARMHGGVRWLDPLVRAWEWWHASRAGLDRVVAADRVRSWLPARPLCCRVGPLASTSVAARRVHKTIPFDRASHAEDAELDAQLTPSATPTDAATEADAVGRSRSSSTGSSSSGSGSSSGDELPAEDAEEDLVATLDLMKAEHQQHLEQFANSTATDAAISPDPASPPIPKDAHRHIFIVAKSLPLQITNLTGLPTPSGTPAGSPLAGPTAPSSSADVDDGFNLGAAAASSDTLPVPNAFDSDLSRMRSPSLSQFGSASQSAHVPGSSVRTVNGNKYRVEWDDSRSFLSNLRCLLTPSPSSASTAAPSNLPPGLSAAESKRDQPEVTWVGLSNVTSIDGFKSETERAAYESTLAVNHCLPVYLPADVQANYQNFNKQILWPLLHYLMPTVTNPTICLQWEAYWQAYLQANQAYADIICAQMQHATSGRPEEPIVWIHNCQLFALPQMIRQQLPRATIGLFIHTPFPSSDVFRSLPTRKELLEAIMEADLLGFHTFDYARHFLSCIKRVLDLDFETLPGGSLGVRYSGRFVTILISHVGIQSSVFAEAANSEVLKRRVEKLRARFAGKKLIASIDDVDVAKAPLLKLQAFDRFLTRHPEWIGKVVILEMFLPSKSMDSDLGAKIQQDLDEAILMLKKNHGEGIIEIIDPIRAGAQKSNDATVGGTVKLMELVRLYNAADVALISGGFDGLNLYPFEFTASQGASVPGALIISEFMGCSRSLNGVLRVNPWSLEAISDALHQALSMSIDERRANHSRRYNYVMHHTVERWATGFLAQLEATTKLGSELTYHLVASGKGSTSKQVMGLRGDFVHLPTSLLTSNYAAADLRVIFLDYDGTLVPADQAASDSACGAAPPTAVRSLLKFLSEDSQTVVFLMSGRTRSVLTRWFGDLPNLGLAAEKGLFLRWPARIASACRFDRQEGEENDPLRRAGGGGASSTDDSSDSDDSSSSEEDESPSSGDIDSPADNVLVDEWECIIPLEPSYLSWKATALDIIRAYTEQTDGSWIEDKEFAIVWHYESADVEYGRMQSSELQKYLVKILANPKVDVLRYDKSRILEVKPHGVSKGLAATAILESLWIHSDKQQRAVEGSPRAIAPRSTPTAAPTSKESRFPGLAVLPPPNSPLPSTAGGLSGLLSPRSLATPFHPFVLAIGDDRSDEDMFVAVQQKAYLDGRVRGRESVPYVDALVRSIASSSIVSSSIPQTPSNAYHDLELSPTPMSPTIGVGTRSLRATSPPSADPFLFTVCVGLKPSNAHYYLNSTEEVLRSLYGLVLSDQEKPVNRDRVQPQLGLARRSSAAASSTAAASSSDSGLGPKRGSFGALASLLFSGSKKE